MKGRSIKIVFITLLTVSIVSCSEKLEDLNVNVKDATTASSEEFFTYSVKSLADLLSQIDYNATGPQELVNIWRLYCQFLTQINGGLQNSLYFVASNRVSDNVWNTLYKDVLQNLKASEEMALSSAAPDADKANKLAIIEIMTVYTYAILVDTFGDVPYTEALDIDKILPVYDDARTIYIDLIRRLDVAISNLNDSGVSFGTADPFYEGDVDKWRKFANSQKLKMGLRIIEAEPEVGEKAAREAIEGGVFVSNDDSAILKYLSATPNTNPLWRSLVESRQQYFVASKAIVDTMNRFNDPRRGVYFTSLNGEYIGAQYGRAISYYSVSNIGQIFHEPDLPGIVFDYATVEFLLAEAAEREIVEGPATAADHYEKAIRASFAYYGVEGVDTYLTQDAVNYATASGDWRQKIGVQKWIALYNQGFEAWTEFRRLDYPELVAPSDAFVDRVPLRFVYPINEQTLNGANYHIASERMGGDLLTIPLFWDINN